LIREVKIMDLNAILQTLIDFAANVGIDLPALIEKLGPILAVIVEFISGLLS
jgi:hypothetical protein